MKPQNKQAVRGDVQLDLSQGGDQNPWTEEDIEEFMAFQQESLLEFLDR